MTRITRPRRSPIILDVPLGALHKIQVSCCGQIVGMKKQVIPDRSFKKRARALHLHCDPNPVRLLVVHQEALRTEARVVSRRTLAADVVGAAEKGNREYGKDTAGEQTPAFDSTVKSQVRLPDRKCTRLTNILMLGDASSEPLERLSLKEERAIQKKNAQSNHFRS